MVGGELDAVPELALHLVGRAFIIGLGLAVLERDPRRLAALAFLGAAAIEVFVLVWAWWSSWEA